MKQSLLEYIFHRVAHRLLFEGRLEDTIKKYKDLPEDAIKDLSQNDPSGNNKYLNWMAKQLADGNEPEQIIDAISKFHKNLSRIKKKDINQFKTLEDLQSEAEPVASTKSRSQEKRSDSMKIFENDEVVVIVPLSEQASCQYGAETRWCISGKKDNAFDRYVNNGSVFAFVISKVLSDSDPNYKISIQMANDGTIGFWDAGDDYYSDKRYLSGIYRKDTVDGIRDALDYDKISNEVINKSCEEIIKSKDSEKAYLLARNVPGVNISKLQQVVIDFGDPEWAYYFARNIGGADIPRLEQAVIDLRNPEWAYYFARNVPGANIPELEQVVIDSGDPEWAYYFAKDIEDANIPKLQQVVVDSEDSIQIYRFARDIPGANRNLGGTPK